MCWPRPGAALAIVTGVSLSRTALPRTVIEPLGMRQHALHSQESNVRIVEDFLKVVEGAARDVVGAVVLQPLGAILGPKGVVEDPLGGIVVLAWPASPLASVSLRGLRRVQPSPVPEEQQYGNDDQHETNRQRAYGFQSVARDACITEGDHALT